MRSTLVLLGFLVALAACGGAATVATPPAAPTGPASAAPPAAPAWFCWAGDTYVSDCQRTLDECAGSLEAAQAALAAPASCMGQPSAWCVTHRLSAGGETTTCLASPQSCDGMSEDISGGGMNTVATPCAETH